MLIHYNFQGMSIYWVIYWALIVGVRKSTFSITIQFWKNDPVRVDLDLH